MKLSFRISAVFVAAVMLLSLLSGCADFGTPSDEPPKITSLTIEGSESRSLSVGDVCVLEILQPDSVLSRISWTADGDAVSVDEYGIVVAKKAGAATVTARYGEFYDTVEFTVTEGEGVSDPYVNVSKSEFYENYTPAKSFTDAYYRTQHGLLSGKLEVQGLAPTESPNRPKDNGMYIRNTNMCYEDNGNTYVVFDSEGNVAFRIYRGAAYITLEEIAAYMFAFGGEDGAFPANYTSSKKTKPTNSQWGEYLRVNHSHFLGDTERYPREPELPNISGCGGNLQYWEMDIGANSYNNGNKITRGVCRLVYGRNDLNGNGVYEKNELHVFYTYNHYDDFQEYLNYEGGWGEMFGYETNGASVVKGPSPYVDVAFRALGAKRAVLHIDCCIPKRYWLFAA